MKLTWGTVEREVKWLDAIKEEDCQEHISLKGANKATSSETK